VSAAKVGSLGNALASLRDVSSAAAPVEAAEKPAKASEDDNGIAKACIRKSLETAEPLVALREATPPEEAARTLSATAFVEEEVKSVAKNMLLDCAESGALEVALQDKSSSSNAVPVETAPTDAEQALKHANEVLKSFNEELRNDNEALDNQANEARNQIASVQAETIVSLQTENAVQRKQIDDLSQQVNELKSLVAAKQG
jgi:hypothetical protein